MIQQSLKNLARTVALCGFVFLAACSTAPEKENSHQGESSQDIFYDRAKSAYLAGNYKLASALFSNLAEKGHANSQYSLGYMYYHGSGLPQDLKQAMHWFNLSAAQGNSNAISALATIQKHIKGSSTDQAPVIKNRQAESTSTTPVIDLRVKKNSTIVTKPAPAVTQSKPSFNKPAPVISQPEPVINAPAPVDTQAKPTITMPEPETTPPETKHPINDDLGQDEPSLGVTNTSTTPRSVKEFKSSRWIMKQPPGYYTIQLSSSTSLKMTLDFINQVELDGVYFFRSTVNQVDRYTVIHGSFPKYGMAKAKISVLKKRGFNNVWIRGLRGIQSAVSRQ